MRWPWQPKKVIDQEFFQRTIKLDGKIHYVGCRFVSCTIMFDGCVNHIVLISCVLDSCQYVFTGPAAMTVALLRLMAVSGLPDHVAGIVGLERTEGQ